MDKKIIVRYRGELCILNQKDSPSATGKVSKTQPLCKDCRLFKFTTPKYKNAKAEIQWKTKQQIQEQTSKNGGMFCKSDGSLQIDMIIYYKNRTDFDSLNKIILDALEGLAYENDSLIKKGTIELKENQPQSGFDLIISQITPQPTLF